MSNSLGKLFTITSFGESHGSGIGVVIDGCPAGLPVTPDDIQQELEKRKSLLNIMSTPRHEEDKVEILSGIFNGFTTGAPVCLMVKNKDIDSSFYEDTRYTARPGHADYTAYVKYGGLNDYRGGGRFSGRITASFVMAGAIAGKLLAVKGIEVVAHTIEIGGITAKPKDIKIIKQNIEENPVKCGDKQAAEKMLKAVAAARKNGDSLGGVVECIAVNMPAGLGEPVFDTLEGDIARALFAIPAVKGVEFGAGFAAARLRGTENNDPIINKNGKIITTTNNAGGILGGISNGMPLSVRAAFKPTPSITADQDTVSLKTGKNLKLSVKGRHDACIVPRAVVVVKSMVAVTLCDFALRAGIIPGVIK
jgi:chorismate synthase